MKQGRLICLEGIEGTGKTTQINFIARYLEKALKQPVLTTREPGGTPLAESIRRLLLNAQNSIETMVQETELLLLFAARSQHIHHVIRPALQKGQWVLCDRFTEASYAYQGQGRGIQTALIETLEKYIHQELVIDRVILLDMPVTSAFHRLKERSEKPLDRIEQESYEFFERVRQGYLRRAEQYIDRYRVIKADQTLHDVHADVVNILDELLFSLDV